MESRKIASYIVVAVIGVVLISYAYFEINPYLGGPQISISHPTNGFLTQENSVLIAGSAAHIAKITLNGSPIFLDENGEFQEEVLLAPGYNVMEVAVVDRYGREKKERRRVVFDTEEPLQIFPVSDATTTQHQDDGQTEEVETNENEL